MIEEGLLGPVCAFLSSVTWAVGSTQYSQLSKYYTPLAVNFTRAVIALPFFILATFFASGGLVEGLETYSQIQSHHWGWAGLSIIASYGIGDVLFLLSATMIGLPTALAIASCFPIWTSLGGVVLGHTILSLTQLLGLFLSVGGVIVVVLAGQKTSESKQSPIKGLALATIASFLWSINGIALTQLSLHLIPPAANTIRMLLALVITFIFSHFLQKKPIFFIPPLSLKGGIAFFILEAFCGSYLTVYGLSHSPLALGVTLTSLAPVVAVPIAVVLGNEKFSLIKTAGIFIVVLGVYCLVKTN